LYYLGLIEQKINALDQAAPLAGWPLPEEFMTLRRLLEARWASRASASSCRFCDSAADGSVRSRRHRRRARAIARGAIGFDAVKHLILCDIERRPPRLDMTVYLYLPRARATMTSASIYLSSPTGASS
jgi:hypothetical protein